jgi:hypothetical protein
MKCLTMGILALSATVTATVAPAADYEIFAPTLTGAPRVNYYAVERFDYKNKQLYHCITFIDTETKPKFAPAMAPSDSNYVRSNFEQFFCVTMRDQRTVGG